MIAALIAMSWPTRVGHDIFRCDIMHAGSSHWPCPTKNKRGTIAALESRMIILDQSLLIGLATIVTSLAALVWAFRRKP
ncbi:hypothetical protein [Sandarakinorhabdus sp. DWP1-3-1]|uniref:hypothetical protein n=1 Tax=Sandarakinorhabdus sp. DWP1-3-1 TaxID=2804627 RepID=UPI003CF0D185